MLYGCCIPPLQYPAAAKAGFDFVELAGTDLAAMSEAEFAQIWEMVASGPIPCLAINCYCDGSLPIVGNVPGDKAILRHAKQICSRGAKLGTRMVGIGSPAARMLPRGYDPALADAQCRHFLQLTVDVAEDYGMTVNFEQLHPRKCNYGNATLEAAALIRGTGRENLGLVVDFYHRYAAGEVVDDFTGFADLIRHTHTSTCGPHYERDFPSMGDLDFYRHVLSALLRTGYSGALSIEAPARDLAVQGRAALKMLRLAEKNGGEDR